MLNPVEGCRRLVGLSRGRVKLAPLQGLMGHLRPIKITMHRMWIGGQNMAQTQGWKAGIGGVVKRCLQP